MNLNKKKIIFISVFILGFILLIGFTYSAFNFVSLGVKENSITTGTITMNYTEGSNEIAMTNALPISDEVGMNLQNADEIFDFTVSVNTSSQMVAYEVTAEKDDSSTLLNNEVRLYLEKSSDKVNYEPVLSPSYFVPLDSDDAIGAKKGEMVLDSSSTNTNITNYYRLRMWVSENFDANDSVKYFTIKVNVYGTTSKVSKLNSCTLLNGKINEIGSEYMCGDNEFILFEDNDDSTKLISKYNLNVSNNYSDLKGEYNPKDYAVAFDEAGYRSDSYCNNPDMGCHVFARTEEVISDSSIKSYTDAFKNKLISKNFINENDDVRLITLDELDSLGCNSGDRSKPGTCRDAKKYVTTSNYWTGTPKTGTNIWDVWQVLTDNELTYDMAARVNDVGLRTVVEIKKNKVSNKIKPNTNAVWVWENSLKELNVSDLTRKDSLNKLKNNNINEVYLSILPDDLENYTSYLKSLYKNNIKVYMLYGDPHFIVEENYDSVVNHNMDVISNFNDKYKDSLHIEGIHYDVEYYFDRSETDKYKEGQSSEAINSKNRLGYINFARRAKSYASTKNLKVAFDVTAFSTNLTTFIDSDGVEKNMLDELLKNSDSLVVMAYSFKPSYIMDSLLYRDYTYEDGSYINVGKNYIEKLNEANKEIIIAFEIPMFTDTYQNNKDNIAVLNQKVPEYKTVFGNSYNDSKDFIVSMEEEVLERAKNHGANKLGIANHDYISYFNLK